MPNGSDMDTHRIYDLTVVHLFKCIFDLGPRAINMLQAPRYLNPELLLMRTLNLKNRFSELYFSLLIRREKSYV